MCSMCSMCWTLHCFGWQQTKDVYQVYCELMFCRNKRLLVDHVKAWRIDGWNSRHEVVKNSFIMFYILHFMCKSDPERRSDLVSWYELWNKVWNMIRVIVMWSQSWTILVIIGVLHAEQYSTVSGTPTCTGLVIKSHGLKWVFHKEDLFWSCYISWLNLYNIFSLENIV